MKAWAHMPLIKRFDFTFLKGDHLLITHLYVGVKMITEILLKSTIKKIRKIQLCIQNLRFFSRSEGKLDVF